jgi:hypothetical protein
MGKFQHSKKAHSDKRNKAGKARNYDITKSGREKLPEDFVYSQNDKKIWNSFCNLLNKRFAEEDLK